MHDPLIAFEHRSEPAGLEVRVNFGMFAGREATPAELDELASALIPLVGEVSVIGEQRYEVGGHSEGAVHQVRVEVATEHLPKDAAERDALRERLLTTTAAWASERIADRHVET